MESNDLFSLYSMKLKQYEKDFKNEVIAPFQSIEIHNNPQGFEVINQVLFSKIPGHVYPEKFLIRIKELKKKQSSHGKVTLHRYTPFLQRWFPTNNLIHTMTNTVSDENLPFRL